MTRIKDFYNDVCLEMGFNTEAVTEELMNSSLPDFASVEIKDNSIVLYDHEEGDCNHWLAITIVNVEGNEGYSETLN